MNPEVLLPLFPLGTVLFPGGVLPLRIFETRYMDMVRECMSQDRPFGVCLITRGNEVGTPADHESIGCTARIDDWDMTEPGVLQLRTVGGSRFRIVERSIQRDGLIRVRTEPIADDAMLPVPEDFSACAALVERVIADVSQREPDPRLRPLAEPYQTESAGWVANRLAELLPLAMPSRQHLMALEDPLGRLALIAELLRREQVI